MCCAALLEIRERRQAERLARENEKNAEKNEFEPTVEVNVDAGVAAEVEAPPPQNDDDDESQRAVVDVRGVDDDAVQKNVAETDATGQFYQLQLDNNAERLSERDSTTAVCVTPLPGSDADREILRAEDMKLSETQEVDDIDVIDLTDITMQDSSKSSRQHVPVCFEVCL